MNSLENSISSQDCRSLFMEIKNISNSFEPNLEELSPDEISFLTNWNVALKAKKSLGIKRKIDVVNSTVELVEQKKIKLDVDLDASVCKWNSESIYDQCHEIVTLLDDLKRRFFSDSKSNLVETCQHCSEKLIAFISELIEKGLNNYREKSVPQFDKKYVGYLVLAISHLQLWSLPDEFLSFWYPILWDLVKHRLYFQDLWFVLLTSGINGKLRRSTTLASRMCFKTIEILSSCDSSLLVSQCFSRLMLKAKNASSNLENSSNSCQEVILRSFRQKV